VTGPARPVSPSAGTRQAGRPALTLSGWAPRRDGTSQDAVGQIEIVPVLDAALADEVSQTRHAREQAEKLRADASAQTRRTARHLREQGMAQRDISALLGISHQAVSQLLAS
jgi:predicted XRE-type DNA-binding protein